MVLLQVTVESTWFAANTRNPPCKLLYPFEYKEHFFSWKKKQYFYLYKTLHETKISSFAVYHTKIYFLAIFHVTQKFIFIWYLYLTLDLLHDLFCAIHLEGKNFLLMQHVTLKVIFLVTCRKNGNFVSMSGNVSHENKFWCNTAEEEILVSCDMS